VEKSYPSGVNITSSVLGKKSVKAKRRKYYISTNFNGYF